MLTELKTGLEEVLGEGECDNDGLWGFKLLCQFRVRLVRWFAVKAFL